MIKNYIKFAWRNLFKQKFYSSLNILGLGLGMATAVLLLLWMYNEYTYDDYHEKANQTYRVNYTQMHDGSPSQWAVTPMMLAASLKSSVSGIENSTRLFQPWEDPTITIDQDLKSLSKLIYVDNNWFDIFDYQLLMGSFADFKSDKNNIVLTKSKALELFGKSDPIDQQIKMGDLNLIVKAVVEDYPPNTSFKFGFYAQIGALLTKKEIFEQENNWDVFNFQTFVVSNKNSPIAELEAKVDFQFKKLKADEESGPSLKLQALTQMHYDKSIEIGSLTPAIDVTILNIFFGIALLILFTACINFVNLTTATSSLRNKEVGIKKFIGISNRSLFFQFFTESTLASLLATICAIGLIYLAIPRLESFVETTFNVSSNPLVWEILLSITLISVLLNGIYPSLLLSKFQALELVKGNSIVGTKKSGIRKGLVVFQFSFTILLIICTGVIFYQMNFIQNRDLGYNKDQVFTFNVPWNVDPNGVIAESIVDQLKQESQLKNITRSGGSIVNFGNSTRGRIDWEGKDKDWNPAVAPMSVASNYQEFFALKLNSGRWFSTENSTDVNNVILNETAVTEFGLKEPIIGQRFTFQDRVGQVIGVVKDFNFKSQRERIAPLLFFKSSWLPTISVKAMNGNIPESLAIVERIWNKNVPNQAFKYEFLDDNYQQMHIAEAKQLTMFYLFGGIALFISCIGLFSLATFAAQVRFKEIGIRKVLGAGITEIINLLSIDFLKLICLAAIIAVPIAYWSMDKWLEGFAYHIDLEWWLFAGSATFVTLSALLTVSYQAIKAALVNPVESLKSE